MLHWLICGALAGVGFGAAMPTSVVFFYWLLDLRSFHKYRKVAAQQKREAAVAV